MKNLFVILLLLLSDYWYLVKSSKYDSYFKNEMLNPSFLKSRVSAEYTSKSGKKVYVFDDVVTYSLTMATRMYYTVNDGWRYVLFDKYVQDPDGKFDDGNGIPWKSWQDPTLMSGTRIGSIWKAMIDAVSSNQTHNLHERPRDFQMTDTYSAILRRGDVTTLHSGVPLHNDTNFIESYSLVTYTSALWRKNSYGEILFYEDDDDDHNVFAVVSPHCSRVVLWDSRVRYLTRPPSISELSGQVMIFAQFQSDPETIHRRRVAFDKKRILNEENAKKAFTCVEGVDSSPSLDVAKHLIMKRLSKNGEFLAVFDDLFDKRDLDALRTYTVKYGKYFYDDHLDLTSDNVQWIAGFQVKKFVQSRFWPIVKKVASFVSGKDTWYPYDIACNLIRSTDHTRMHLDVAITKEEEMTFLLYLNPNWTADYYGETAFMEHNYDTPENDYVAEVIPYYGRAVIFDGNFPHSAHPPAPDYPGPRYTFAVKLAVNKMVAIEKIFGVEAAHSTESMDEILRQLKSDPAKFEAMHKISVVASYLHTRQVQKAIREKPKTEESILETMNFQSNDGGEDERLIGALLSYEDEIVLNEENRQLILQMAKFYKLDEDAVKEFTRGTNSENDDGEKDNDKERDDDEIQQDNSSEPPVISRDRAIATWEKFCQEDADCMDDFLELFLRQQEELKRRTVRDLLAVI
ncbi:uncharacterized protein LOC143465783 isoform X1 [Clavelina lepadiformis]|uniref:uncharacterized protein LOC143465783 isoform X1 n=1 Tax=Clavelina lepadiformis TaxID=159417 RepID=UPI004042FE1B